MPPGRNANEIVVRRFYRELCNEWRLDLAEELLSERLRFRASLGSSITGRGPFVRYMQTVRRVFPDLHHRLDEILVTDERVAARLMYSGTHRGRLDDIEPTGARFEYAGAAFFRLSGGVIERGLGRRRYPGAVASARQAVGRPTMPTFARHGRAINGAGKVIVSASVTRAFAPSRPRCNPARMSRRRSTAAQGWGLG